jgi:hypothetical protein
LVDLDEEVDDRLLTVRRGASAVGIPFREPSSEKWCGFFVGEIRRQLATQCFLVVEGEVCGRLFDEEVERVDDREVGDEIDDNGEFARGLGEHETRKMISERILLPVDEVLGRRDRHRVGEDRRAAVRRRTQSHHVRGQCHCSVEAVGHAVLERDADAHPDPKVVVEARAGGNIPPLAIAIPTALRVGRITGP